MDNKYLKVVTYGNGSIGFYTVSDSDLRRQESEKDTRYFLIPPIESMQEVKVEVLIKPIEK